MSSVSAVSSAAYYPYAAGQAQQAQPAAQPAAQGYDPDHDGDQDTPGKLDVKA